MDKAVSKYIKITGVMKSTGDYELEHDLHRPYDAITFLDSEGVEIHFHKFLVAKRLDDTFQVGQQATFYILRSWIGGMLVGDLYAVEVGDEKHFYPDTAIPQLKDHTFSLDRRGQIAGGLVGAPGLFAVIAGLAMGVVATMVVEAAGIGYEAPWWGRSTLFLMFCIPLVIWVFSIDKEELAEINEVKADLEANGFNLSGKGPVVAHSSKC